VKMGEEGVLLTSLSSGLRKTAQKESLRGAKPLSHNFPLSFEGEGD